jgi:hypothetical protein
MKVLKILLSDGLRLHHLLIYTKENKYGNQIWTIGEVARGGLNPGSQKQKI